MASYYYPFGLTMAGISSKSAGIQSNKDKTFQGQKFDDDLGINYYSFKWRNHDPQIGRFIEIDPLSEDYEYNSPYAFSENKVTSHVELEGLEALEFMRLIYDNVSDGLYRTGEWINNNLNPVVNAVEFATGKSNESNFTEQKPRINSLTELGISLFPGGKLEGTAAKTIVKMEEKTAVEVVQRAMSKDELKATEKEGLIRGGREGTHHVSDAIGSDAKKVRQRLALPQTPEIKATMEVPKGSFSKATKVEAANKMPGGGLERKAVGNIPAKVIKVEELKNTGR